MAADNRPAGSVSGLTENEAKEFHNLFMTSFFAFTAVAAVAHLLVWTWRPWFPGPRGYVSLDDGVMQSVASIVSVLT